MRKTGQARSAKNAQRRARKDAEKKRWEMIRHEAMRKVSAAVARGPKYHHEAVRLANKYNLSPEMRRRAGLVEETKASRAADAALLTLMERMTVR